MTPSKSDNFTGFAAELGGKRICRYAPTGLQAFEHHVGNYEEPPMDVAGRPGRNTVCIPLLACAARRKAAPTEFATEKGFGAGPAFWKNQAFHE